MYSKRKKQTSGFTLIELLITMAISSLLALVVGVLLVGGQRNWENTYRDANGEMRVGSHALMAAFGSMGRQSNRLNYKLYTLVGSSYIESTPSGNSEEVVFGDAVEFRYWQATGPDPEILDISNTGTHYAFFYLDDDTLKVDYGQTPPGAIPGGTGPKNESDITTLELAQNVIPNPSGAFNHTMIGGVGQGCVRIDVTIEDEDEDSDKTVRVMTATLLRNIWPR